MFSTKTFYALVVVESTLFLVDSEAYHPISDFAIFAADSSSFLPTHVRVRKNVYGYSKSATDLAKNIQRTTIQFLNFSRLQNVFRFNINNYVKV